jgi:hypothetical protein
MRFSVLVAIVLMWSSLAYGQDDDTVGPDRPSFSSSAHTVPAGHVQLEGGVSRWRYGNAEGDNVGELLVRVGVSDRIEMRALVPSYLIVRDPGGRVSGADDTLVESKFRFRSRDRAAFGILASAILPTGSRSVAEHTFQPGATLISDIQAKKFVSITSNVGYFRATNFISTTSKSDRFRNTRPQACPGRLPSVPRSTSMVESAFRTTRPMGRIITLASEFHACSKFSASSVTSLGYPQAESYRRISATPWQGRVNRKSSIVR